MSKFHKLSERADKDDIKLMRDNAKHHTATIEFHREVKDGYYVTITKVNDDGTFEGKLHSVAPMI